MPLILSLIVAIPLIGFWAWMARDLTQNDDLRDEERRFWTMMLLFFNVLGAGAYYWYVYQKRSRP